MIEICLLHKHFLFWNYLDRQYMSIVNLPYPFHLHRDHWLLCINKPVCISFTCIFSPLSSNYIILCHSILHSFFKKDFIYFQREGKGGRRRGRETSMCGCPAPQIPTWTWPTIQACAPTGNWTGDPSAHRPELTEPHQLGLYFILISVYFTCYLTYLHMFLLN